MHVLIVGAGLGGLTLAACLEKAGVAYTVIERSEHLKPLGSAMSLNPSIYPVLKQLGIYEEFIRLSVSLKVSKHYTDKFEVIHDFDCGFIKERFGEYLQITDRPALSDLLLTLVPKDKIHYGKKVMGLEQDEEAATVRASDGTVYRGDLAVGADGAYSAVRQALYKSLKEKGELPQDDDTCPPYNTTCIVGITRSLPPEIFDPNDGGPQCMSITYGGLPYMALCFPGQNSRCEWMVLEYSDDCKTRDDERFRNSEWGPEASQGMCDAVRDLPSPLGKGQKLSSLIDNTDKDGICKVMLEEKLYKTWHHGRIVLLGDACHKFFPAAGFGAVTAMLDAIALANVLEACPTNDVSDIKRCLDVYKQEQFAVAKKTSFTSYLVGVSWRRNTWGRFVRFLTEILPNWFKNAEYCKPLQNQPQLQFLPPVKPSGSVTPNPQKNYDHLRTSVASRAI